jgi:Cytochrome P460
MVEKFKKVKIAVVSVSLGCALVFFINQRAASTVIPVTASNLSSSSQVKEIEGYKNWTKVNAVPQLMPKPVAALCAVWTSRAGVVVNGESNPHRDKYFTVYVNDTGRQAMLGQKNPKFPEGSVIVKEKLAAPDSTEPELLTVMIKQKKGFNRESGDWEYMVVDGTGTKIEGRGNLQNCHTCHIANQKTDYIFRTYLPGEAASKLR